MTIKEIEKNWNISNDNIVAKWKAPGRGSCAASWVFIDADGFLRYKGQAANGANAPVILSSPGFGDEKEYYGDLLNGLNKKVE